MFVYGLIFKMETSTKTGTLLNTFLSFFHYDYWVRANIIYPYLRGSPYTYSDLYVSSSILPGSNLL